MKRDEVLKVRPQREIKFLCVLVPSWLAFWVVFLQGLESWDKNLIELEQMTLVYEARQM